MILRMTAVMARPISEDGREYPKRLRAYEAFDEQLFPRMVELGEVTPVQEVAADIEHTPLCSRSDAADALRSQIATSSSHLWPHLALDAGETL